MYQAKNYAKPETLAEAYELNQKKANILMAGNMWLRLGERQFGTVIDLSGLGLASIEETETEFQIGAMVTLRQLEQHKGLLEAFGPSIYRAVQDIVGTQFRNMATVGGSIWGRFGFSDVLTVFLGLDTEVELYKAGRLPLMEFLNMPKDRDLLVRIIVKKSGRKISYQALRNTATDFPVISCAASRRGEEYRFVVGARPNKAVCFTLPAAGLLENPKQMIKAETDKLSYGSNSRATAAYRREMAAVLLNRAVREVEGGEPYGA